MNPKRRGSYYQQATAAVEAGDEQLAEMLLHELVSDGDLNRRHTDSGTFRPASEVRGWLVPFLDSGGTQRLVDALLQTKGAYEEFENLWRAIEYSAPGVFQNNFRRVVTHTGRGPTGWGAGWRNASDPAVIDYLGDHLDGVTDNHDSEGLTLSILHTRNPELIESLLEHPSGPFQIQKPSLRPLYDVAPSLAWAGFALEGTRLVDQTIPRRLQLTFPHDYRVDDEFGHPTRDLSGPDLGVAGFGGLAQGRCSICHVQLHRYLELEDQLDVIGVHSRPKIELVVCYDCRNCAHDMFNNVLWYKHDEAGRATSLSRLAVNENWRKTLKPMPSMAVSLRDAPLDRWVSDYFHHPYFENLNYLGGVPTNTYLWASPMRCIDCDAVMQFLANVNETPFADPLLFYWCDSCAISGVAGQNSG